MMQNHSTLVQYDLRIGMKYQKLLIQPTQKAARLIYGVCRIKHMLFFI